MKESGLFSKRSIVIIIALFCMFGFGFFTPFEGMTQAGMQVLGVFCGVMILWMCVAIDWPSLLLILALSFVPCLGFKDILKSSLGNDTFAFLLFSFICTAALAKTSFIRRVAVAFITSKFAKKGPWHFTFFFFTAIIVIGCFMSPSVLFVVCLPILEEIYELFELKKGDRFATMLIIGLVCCCGIASGMTPIGHAYGPLAIGAFQSATGATISYVDYMKAAVPVGIVTYVAMFLLFKFVMRPDTSCLKDVNADALKITEPVTTREWMIIGVFFIVVLLWIAPSFLKPILPDVYQFINSKTVAFPPLVGIILMSILTMDGKPLLPLNDALKYNVAWPALINTMGTMALGAAMSNKDVVLTAFLGDLISPITTQLAPIILVGFFILWVAIMTNLSSNIVSITVVTNIAIPVCLALNGAVNAAAVACLVGMMGGYAFAAPPAMPSVSLSIGTGWVDSGTILRWGFTIMAAAVIAAVVVGYPIAAASMVY